MAEIVVKPDWQALKAQELVMLLRDAGKARTKVHRELGLNMATEAIAEALHDAYLRGVKDGKGGAVT